jgi:hypothetical protein
MNEIKLSFLFLLPFRSMPLFLNFRTWLTCDIIFNMVCIIFVGTMGVWPLLTRAKDFGTHFVFIRTIHFGGLVVYIYFTFLCLNSFILSDFLRWNENGRSFARFCPKKKNCVFVSILSKLVYIFFKKNEKLVKRMFQRIWHDIHRLFPRL